MRRTGRSAGLLGAAAMVMSVAACTADSGGGGAEASCATLYTYQDRSYQDVANVKFTLGKKLGVATQPASCEDTGGHDESEPVMTETAYEVDGISPKVAIAIGDTPKTATFFAVHSGPELPPEVQKLIDGS
ncbi:DUF6281 family protein [Streptomyces sp. B1I3]|uniref:DUF6281 family protein n=1 Tax=Streptomyces sp. B1I3 TaxID=3042264 RepID=UPI00278694DD|nr:DUF6281 family protein [Streptomyces sp. B1I3]MDQ0791676.1 hypothetical protein [Streptomyces sp. B1I3]